VTSPGARLTRPVPGPSFGLAGKRALITGSTAGIGFAAAVRLAREKARVVLNGIAAHPDVDVRVNNMGIFDAQALREHSPPLPKAWAVSWRSWR